MTDRFVVLTPMAIEAAAIRRHSTAEVLRCGVGPHRVAAAAASVADGSGPVVVAGFCGAASSDLRPGDVVVATEVRGEGPARECKGAGPLAAAMRRRGLNVHLGPVASS